MKNKFLTLLAILFVSIHVDAQDTSDDVRLVLIEALKTAYPIGKGSCETFLINQLNPTHLAWYSIEEDAESIDSCIPKEVYYEIYETTKGRNYKDLEKIRNVTDYIDTNILSVFNLFKDGDLWSAKFGFIDDKWRYNFDLTYPLLDSKRNYAILMYEGGTSKSMLDRVYWVFKKENNKWRLCCRYGYSQT